MVCRDLARGVGGTTEPIGGGAEMRLSRSLDRLELSLAVWPVEPDREQQPLPDPARLAAAKYRFAGVVADRAAGGGRLADTVRSSVVFAEDFC